MSILRFVHAVCDLLAIGAGTIVLFGLLAGELIDKWAVLFLRCTLATSVIGLLFQLHAFTLVQRCSMLAVYASGVAILAWRKFHLSGVWRTIFALTITIVLYLNVVVAIDQVFDQMFRFTRWMPAQFELTSRATQYVVMVLFAVIGIVAVKRFHSRGAHSLRSHTNGVTDKHVF
jgi:hypothetical protein